ncbi:probable E3 ubiquitin-protein ligase makorin-1 [Cloeon dipterum]|uniref:probable E3 ubiquitin-protein ligase makorin-1 n=1 Tax=Cloeon dipterum TaxID=197152 RepID=UPI0032209A79
MAAERRPLAPCRFFSNNGSCRQGDSCPFPHVARSGPVPCRYFLEGRCMFGIQCRNIHTSGPRSEDDDDDDSLGAASIARQQQTSRRNQENNRGRNTASSSSSSNADNRRFPLTENHRKQSFRPNNRRGRGQENKGAGSSISPTHWAAAPEFVPKTPPRIPVSYADALNVKRTKAAEDAALCVIHEDCLPCPDGQDCVYVHGEFCELCCKFSLHPFNEDQRKKHTSECIKQHEKDMELSFAVARSKDKMCGICFETIVEKSPREQRFGILPNCNHCFCLNCIRTWRQAKNFENNITRGCPECRTASDFVCPSVYWVETKEEKDKLINDYKLAMQNKDCKYFKRGEGKCPFGNKCFYQHNLPNGTHVDVGPPTRARRRNGADGEVDLMQHIILWDFLDEHDSHFFYLDELDLDDSIMTDSEISDSDYEYLY